MCCISFSMNFPPSLLNYKIFIIKIRIYFLLYIWSKLLPSSLDVLLKLSKTTYWQKLFTSHCITLLGWRQRFRPNIWKRYISGLLLWRFKILRMIEENSYLNKNTAPKNKKLIKLGLEKVQSTHFNMVIINIQKGTWFNKYLFHRATTRLPSLCNLTEISEYV